MVSKEFEDYRLEQAQFQRPNELPAILNHLGFWFMELLTDHNLTGTSDWTPTFEDTTEPRTISYILTAGGWLPPQIVGGDDRDARWRIAFWNDGPPYSVDVTLDFDTAGGLQTIINGSFTHYAVSSQELTWQFRTGPNEVCIMIGDGAERLTMSGRLWDGVQSRWTDQDWMSGWNRG